MSRYVKKDSRITYIKEADPLSVGAARNRTIKENPDFPIVAYHDVDDIMIPDRLEQSIRSIRNSDLIYGNMRAFEVHHNMITSFPYVNFKLLLNYNLINAPTACFRYKVWKVVSGFDEGMRSASDYDFWLRVAKAGFKFKYLNQVLTRYRIHLDSITNLESRKMNIFQKKEIPAIKYARSKHTSKHMGIKTVILWLLTQTWQRLHY
jgi:GT2 family glycosyltransferase